MKKFILALTVSLSFSLVFAQNNVGIGTPNPAPSSILDLSATDKGFLIPRVTTAQRTAISTPANGLMVYDTDVQCIFFYNSVTSIWVSLCQAGGGNGPTGATGAQGVAGANGVDGATGPIGANGIDGVTGPTGLAGTPGVTGPPGPTGATGIAGIGIVNIVDNGNGTFTFELSDGTLIPTTTDLRGATGATGLDGTNGTNGIDGATGATGLDGTNGTNGIDGATGATGQNGTNGTNGVDGATGATGQNGTNGTNGVNGVTGATGQNGTNGTNGVDGATGATGQNGTNGTNGVDGATGATGQNGTNGTNGIDGVTGATGQNGTNGTNGVDGATGATGQNGTNGTNGVDGATGATGQNGTNGTNGIDGVTGATGQNGTNGTNGVDGATGATGQNGTNGTNGVNGVTGATGQNGTNGTNGVDGATGATGQNGTNGTNGVDGATGATGQNGTNGTNGVNGVTGATGQNGTNGTNGVDGATGATGQNGTNGTNGVDGATGATGQNGTNGTNGVDGATGATGQNGTNGTNGVDGATGATGQNGTNGTNGVDGATGATGQNGTNGTNGVDGATGATGQNGTNGTNGIDGVTGATGQNGTNGTNGVDGATGATGQNGTNGTNGVDGTTGATGQNGTNGTNGIDGVTGATGQNGTNGTNGVDGATGATGQNGTNGTNGVNGVTGATGQNGTNGTNGVDGATGATGQNGTNGTNGVNGVTGATGQNGTNGTNGVNGVTGATGQNGTNGTNGVNGATGATGQNGTNGVTGPTGTVNGTAGGDLQGTYPNPIVDGILGDSIVGPALTNAVLRYNGTRWVMDTASQFWKLVGNASTNPNNNYIGTTDNLSLSVRTNAVESFRVTPKGEIVVGDAITNTGANAGYGWNNTKVQINMTAKTAAGGGGASDAVLLRQSSNTASDHARLIFYRTRGTYTDLAANQVQNTNRLGGVYFRGYNGANGATLTTNNGDGASMYSVVESPTAGNGFVPARLVFATSDGSTNAAVDRFWISKWGEITTGPTYPTPGTAEQFNVESNAVIDFTGFNSGNLGTGSIMFGSGTNTGIASNRALATPGTNRYGLDFYTGGTRRVAITQTGRVGVGTLDPDATYKMQIEALTDNGLLLTNTGSTGIWVRNNGVNLSNTTNSYTGSRGVIGNAIGVGVEGIALEDANTLTNHAGGSFATYDNTGSTVIALGRVGAWDGGTAQKIVGLGAMSTIVRDDNNNGRIMYAPEAPEVLLQDFGEGELINGKAHINIDPVLTKNIVVDAKHTLKVFVTLKGDCNGVYVTNETASGFDVVELKGGTSNVKFSWFLSANRADEMFGTVKSHYQDKRFPVTELPYFSTEQNKKRIQNENALKAKNQAEQNKMSAEESIKRDAYRSKLKEFNDQIQREKRESENKPY